MANSAYENLSKKLITHLLGFQENEVNFRRSQEYVMSNLLYHHCLDVNAHEVRRRIEGLLLKFSVHGHEKTSDRLRHLIEKFKAAPEFEGQTELDWSLLFFLLEVSQRPTAVKHDVSDQLSIISEESRSDNSEMTAAAWHSLLHEDEPLYYLGPEEPLSDWSSTSSSDSEPESEDDDSRTDAKTPTSTESPTKSLLNEAYLSQTQLDFMVQPSYWAKSFIDVVPPHPAGVIPERLLGDGEAKTVKEYHVIREILWLLMKPSSGFIFTRGNDGYVTLSQDICISSLSKSCLGKLLKQIEDTATELEELDAWSAQAEKSTDNILTPPLRSYAAGLHLWRITVTEELVKVEEEVRHRDECTSLIWLLKRIQPLLNQINLVAKVHKKVFNSNYHHQSQPLRLLSVLVTSVESATDPSHRAILLRLFLHSLRYHMHLISQWLQQSSSCSNLENFILYRNKEISTKDPRFWENAYLDKIPGMKNSIAQELNLPGLDFLRCIRSLLAEVGLVRELLEVCFKGSEYKLITADFDVEKILIGKIAEMVGTNNKKTSDRKFSECQIPTLETLSLFDGVTSFDPYLVEAFKETPKENEENSDKETKIIESLDAKHSIKLDKILSNILLPIVQRQQIALGNELTNVLMEQFKLHEHLLVVRSVFLFEAGDIMNDFFSHMFGKITNAEMLEDTDLTLYLQFCIGRKFPDLCDNFSVKINGNPKVVVTDPTMISKTRQEVVLSSISIDYKAPWPIFFILNERIMRKYNRLLQFCLSMKRAISLLQRLHFRELVSDNNSSYVSYADQKSNDDTPLSWRLHRLQLLRQWLLYFCNGVHDHFATTALMPFHYSMEKLLETRPNLGTLLKEHNRLLNDVSKECLLPEDKQSPVLDTFNQVLAVVEKVAKLWVGNPGEVTIKVLTELEENYATCHRYLVNLLVAITKSQFNPHLEALYMSLVNSCPLNV